MPQKPPVWFGSPGWRADREFSQASLEDLALTRATGLPGPHAEASRKRLQAMADGLSAQVAPENYVDGWPVYVICGEMAETLCCIVEDILNNETQPWVEVARPKRKPLRRLTAQSQRAAVIFYRAMTGTAPSHPRHHVCPAMRACLAAFCPSGNPIEILQEKYSIIDPRAIRQWLRDDRHAADDPFDNNPGYDLATRAYAIDFDAEHGGKVWQENKTSKIVARQRLGSAERQSAGGDGKPA